MNPLANPLASIQPLPPQQQMAASKRQGANPLLDWVGNADQQTAPMSNKMARRGNPLGDAMPVMSAEGPAAPTQGGPVSGMPYGMGGQPKQDNPLGAAFGSFARGFLGPERTGQIDAQHAERENAKLTKTLTWLQQTAAQPAEQRVAFTQRFAQQIAADTGQPVEAIMASLRDPNGFSDQSIQQGIAALSAQLGQAPEQPEYMNLGGGNVGKVQGGVFSMAQTAPEEPVKPINVDGLFVDPTDPKKVLADHRAKPETDWQEHTDASGQLWQYDPTGQQPARKVQVPRARVPGADSGTQTRYENVSAEEMASLGYPEGTIGQRNVTTGQIDVKARPSTQQTGQPTEGERKFALYATSAQGALKDIDSIEFGKDYTDGVEPIWERGNQMNPFDEKSRKYDQAIDRFLDGWSRAMTGAAMTTDEKNFYYGIMKPTFGDSPAVRIQKAQTRHKMAADLAIAASRGMTPYNLRDQAAAAAQTSQQLPPGVTQEMWDVMDDEDRAAFQ